MQVSQLTIDNFRGIRKAALQFSGHTLLIGGNNVGRSTICEALDLVLGPDRLNRTPPVEEFDFRASSAGYLADDGETVVPIRIEAMLAYQLPHADMDSGRARDDKQATRSNNRQHHFKAGDRGGSGAGPFAVATQRAFKPPR